MTIYCPAIIDSVESRHAIWIDIRRAYIAQKVEFIDLAISCNSFTLSTPTKFGAEFHEGTEEGYEQMSFSAPIAKSALMQFISEAGQKLAEPTTNHQDWGINCSSGDENSVKTLLRISQRKQEQLLAFQVRQSLLRFQSTFQIRTSKENIQNFVDELRGKMERLK